MTTYDNERKGLYRSRKGAILGVCRGLAERLDFSVFWTRVIVVCLMIFTAFWPVVIAYFLAALLMKPEPVIPFQSEDDEEFYSCYTSSRSMALHRLKDAYTRLNRRIQRMEHIVTSKDYDWDNKLNT